MRQGTNTGRQGAQIAFRSDRGTGSSAVEPRRHIGRERRRSINLTQDRGSLGVGGNIKDATNRGGSRDIALNSRSGGKFIGLHGRDPLARQEEVVGVVPFRMSILQSDI